MKGQSDHLTIGERVAFYRKRRGLTQRVLAELVGRTEEWLRKVESDTNPLDRLSVITALARVLGVGLGDLLGAHILLEWKDSRERASVPALRVALTDHRQYLPLPSNADDSAVDLDRLATQLADAFRDYQGSQYTRLTLQLPSVVTDAVFASGQAPPAIVVYVDTWTAYGGSQFVDSHGTGRYHSYLCDEVVPWVDAHYRTVASSACRAIMGKSSGGFGAMITPMLRPDLFGALATHAGDALYENCYIPEFGTVVRHLRDYDGDIWRWWDDFRSRVSFTKEADHDLLMLLGVSACFSANPDGRVELPFEPRTARLRPDVWQRWLDWDPVRMAPQHAEALRGLRGIWIDAGTHDEWFLDLGATAFRAALDEAGVPDEVIHFELFEGTHMSIDYRYPASLAWLAARIAV